MCIRDRLHAACICTISYQPGAVEVQTTAVLLLLYGLKSSRLCSLPWQQCDSRRQLREDSSTYAYHTCLSSTLCTMRTAVSVVELLLILYCCTSGTRRKLAAFFCEYKTRRIRHVVTTFYYECVCGTSTAKATTSSSYKQQCIWIRIALCVYDCRTAVLLFKAVREGCHMFCSSCCM